MYYNNIWSYGCYGKFTYPSNAYSHAPNVNYVEINASEWINIVFLSGSIVILSSINM